LYSKREYKVIIVSNREEQREKRLYMSKMADNATNAPNRTVWAVNCRSSRDAEVLLPLVEAEALAEAEAAWEEAACDAWDVMEVARLEAREVALRRVMKEKAGREGREVREWGEGEGEDEGKRKEGKRGCGGEERRKRTKLRWSRPCWWRRQRQSLFRGRRWHYNERQRAWAPFQSAEQGWF
jgi:hypothetical protein